MAQGPPFRGRIHVNLDVTQTILSVDLLQMLNPDPDSCCPVNRVHAYHTPDESVTRTKPKCHIAMRRSCSETIGMDFITAPEQANKQSCGAGNIGQAVKTLLAACESFSETVRSEGPRLLSSVQT
jgi:hypothetical protein